jgi:hypothetical protein
MTTENRLSIKKGKHSVSFEFLTGNSTHFKAAFIIVLSCMLSLIEAQKIKAGKEATFVGQHTTADKGERQGTDTLTREEKNISDNFIKFLMKTGLPERLPFAKIGVIDPTQLPYSTVEVWIGKGTDPNGEGYSLFLLDSTKDGANRDDPNYNFQMAAKNQTETVEITKFEFGQEATYKTMPLKGNIEEIMKKLKRFKDYLKDYDPRIKFPYTFIFRPKDKALKHIFATVNPEADIRKKGSNTGRTNAKDGLFEFAALEFEYEPTSGNYIVVNTTDIACCCQIPPAQ